MATIRTKALAYLRDGKVTVRRAAADDDGPRRARFVHADVVGHNSTYIVTLGTLLSWSCTCGAREYHGECAHIAAVQLVTGHPSAAHKAGVDRLIADLKAAAADCPRDGRQTPTNNP